MDFCCEPLGEHLRFSYLELEKSCIIKKIKNKLSFELTSYWSWARSHNSYCTEALASGRLWNTLNSLQSCITDSTWIRIIHLNTSQLRNRKDTIVSYQSILNFSVGCVRQPFGPSEASWVDFSTYEANGPITQIDVATYGIHTVG